VVLRPYGGRALPGGGGLLRGPGLELRLADPIVAIDAEARTVTFAKGRTTSYDALVLATGSAPFVPPVPGATGPGRFVYRTLADLAAIRDHAGRATRGAVVGGGLLGLEAANALLSLGLDTSVVEFAPRLMPVQVDEGGGQALRRLVEGLGVRVLTGASTQRIEDADSACGVFAGGDPLDVDLVVFSAVSARTMLSHVPPGSRSASGAASSSTSGAPRALRTSTPSASAPARPAAAGGSWLPATSRRRSSSTDLQLVAVAGRARHRTRLRHLQARSGELPRLARQRLRPRR